jgi:hypothetical protein
MPAFAMPGGDGSVSISTRRGHVTLSGSADDPSGPTATRSERRRRQVRHLVACGERCVLEALIAVDNGQPLDLVLLDFERLHPDAYKLTAKVIKGTT